MTLTDKIMADIARTIGSESMATIAVKDLGISFRTVENLKVVRQGDSPGFNRDLLILWRNKNPGVNQAQVSELQIKIPLMSYF